MVKPFLAISKQAKTFLDLACRLASQELAILDMPLVNQELAVLNMQLANLKTTTLASFMVFKQPAKTILSEDNCNLDYSSYPIQFSCLIQILLWFQ